MIELEQKDCTTNFDGDVRKQVEFYFSDSNLQTDNFLWKLCEKNDGWIDLDVILTFNRMKKYKPITRVIEALKKSTKIILSEDEKKVKRKDPLMDFKEMKLNRKKMTVHLEGFSNDVTQDSLESFFSKKILTTLPKEKDVSAIRMVRRKVDKLFFGVVNVEFKTEEDSEYFLNNINFCYPDGIIEDENNLNDKKTTIKKMRFLEFEKLHEKKNKTKEKKNKLAEDSTTGNLKKKMKVNAEEQKTVLVEEESNKEHDKIGMSSKSSETIS